MPSSTSEPPALSARSRGVRGLVVATAVVLLAGALVSAATGSPPRPLASRQAVAAPQRTAEAGRLPPEQVGAQGLDFRRRTTVAFLLDPGERAVDPAAVYVTVPVTWIPDGLCAQLYLPVVSKETATSVTLTTWEYTPRQTDSDLACAGVGHGDRQVRLPLAQPLGQRQVLVSGHPGPAPVLLLGATPSTDPTGSGLAPAQPTRARICLAAKCVTVTDRGLLNGVAGDVNGALPVRPGGGRCSDAGRTDNVDRTYGVTFITGGRPGPQLEVPLGCSPIGVVGSTARYLAAGTDEVRLAYDQQITPADQCLGIGGPSGGPPTRDYVGLTVRQAEQHADATDNDVIRVAGTDGVCAGIVRDHVINRVDVYLQNGIVTAAKSF